MVDYSYPKLASNWDAMILQCKILRLLDQYLGQDINLDGVSMTRDQAIIIFKNELTSQEKTKLDNFMAQNDAGLYPSSTTGYTRFAVLDVKRNLAKLESAVGGSKIVVIPVSPSKIELWVSGSLTTAQKNSLLKEYSNLASEVT